MTTNHLFSNVKMGALTLKNRIFMAPMTRSRAGAGAVPSPMMAEYYSQRASAGLIITEGIALDPMGQGYLRIPGLYTAEQVKGWRQVTDAVHKTGGAIFAQLMYVGRVSHPSFLGGVTPVAPSAVRAKGQVYTATGPQDFVTPRAMEENEIVEAIDSYRRATSLAFEAGFDGVEIHATSGYLPAQFLTPGINQRTDRWGGSLENRSRFLLAVADAAASVKGAGHVGVRVGPGFTFNDVHDPNPEETYAHVAAQLSPRNLAYLHVVDSKPGWDVIGTMRAAYRGFLIANGGFERDTAESAVATKRADAVAFGVKFLANPDLPERLRLGTALNAPRQDRFYTEGPEGYVDYPALEGTQRAAG